MAAPVFRAAGAKSAGTTGAVTVAAPAGVATGDLEILISATIAGGSVSITTAGGSAWTVMTGSPIDVASGQKLYVWWRVRQAGDGDPQVTPGSDHSCSARLAYETGTFDTSDPFEIETTGTETASDTSFSWAPGTSTGGADRLVLVVSSILRDSNTASVPICTDASLTSLASRANFCTNFGGGGGFGVTEGTLASAGGVGTFACTYAAASPKAYISFAIKPSATTWFGASSLTTTASITTTGTRTTFGAVSVTETAAAVTAGTRTTFGASTLTTTVAITTAGARQVFGAASLTVTAQVSTNGIRTATAAASLTTTASITTAGTRSTFGQVSRTTTAQVQTAGTRSTFGAASLTTTVGIVTAGARQVFGAASLTVTVAAATAGTRSTFAAVSLTVAAAVTVAGTRKTFGASSTTVTVTRVTTGTRTTFGAVSLTETLAVATSGLRTTFGVVSRTETVTITTAGDILGGYLAGAGEIVAVSFRAQAGRAPVRHADSRAGAELR